MSVRALKYRAPCGWAGSLRLLVEERHTPREVSFGPRVLELGKLQDEVLEPSDIGQVHPHAASSSSWLNARRYSAAFDAMLAAKG